jgi:hypothetical protein
VIQRIHLIPDSEGKGTFDAEKLRQAIQGLGRTTNWRNEEDTLDEGTLFECQLECSEKEVEPIPVQVRKDLSSLSIGGYHDDGLKAALDIQRRYGKEVFAFSEESSPAIVALSAIRSPRELGAKLKLR